MTSVLDLDEKSEQVADSNCGRHQFSLTILEGGVRQSVAEREEWGGGEIPVCATSHCVVAHRRHLGKRVKSEEMKREIAPYQHVLCTEDWYETLAKVKCREIKIVAS